MPTTKILAISHAMGAPMTPEQRAAIMPHEVHDTVNAYLDGKIDQWYFQTDGKGVVFIVNASTPAEAKAILEKFPLGQAGLMGFDYIPLGPLNPCASSTIWFAENTRWPGRLAPNSVDPNRQNPTPATQRNMAFSRYKTHRLYLSAAIIPYRRRR